MARIQRLNGIFYFGENNEVSVYYDAGDSRWKVVGKKITNFGAEVGVDLYPAVPTLDQPFTVRAVASMECVVNNVVVASGIDSVAPAGAGVTNHVGVAMENIGAGMEGQIAVAGVVTVISTNAVTAGHYLITANAGGVTDQVGLPGNGTLVGIARNNTGGAGAARCWLRLGAY